MSQGDASNLARPTHLNPTTDDDSDSETSYDERQDVDTDSAMLPEAALIPDGTPETSTPSDADGMLARDVQRKTAYYDYAAEKSLSQADSKLFYQRSQLEGQKTGGSNWGASQASQHGSPVLQPRFASKFGADSEALRSSGSVTSSKSAQRLVVMF